MIYDLSHTSAAFLRVLQMDKELLKSIGISNAFHVMKILDLRDNL